MAGRQDGIPIAAASARLGLSAEAVRKRLQRGTLHGYKDDDGGWFVLPGDLHGTAGRQDTVRTDRQDDGRTPRPDGRTPPEEPIEAAYRVTPAEIAQAVSSTSAQYMGDLRTMLAEVGKVYEGQLAAKDETIAELRWRAEAAERAANVPTALEQGQARILAERGSALLAKEELLTMQRRAIAELREQVDRLKVEREEARRFVATAPSEPAPPRSWWARLFRRD